MDIILNRKEDTFGVIDMREKDKLDLIFGGLVSLICLIIGVPLLYFFSGDCSDVAGGLFTLAGVMGLIHTIIRLVLYFQ